jgi:predicted phosphoribosyltransferase
MGPFSTYVDRAEAGAVLAAALAELQGRRVVVAALPRGGVAVALPIARALGAPLTLSFARKLAIARAPELAVGAIDEDGQVITDPGTLAGLGASLDELVEARERAEREIARQRETFPVTPLAAHPPEASVVLVDDGPATGLTLRAAVAHARRHGAREVIVAVPCSSASAARRLEREANRFICPRVDRDFLAVGRYYTDFHQVSDAEVLELLERARGQATPS